MQTFMLKRGNALFDFGNGILDDYNFICEYNINQVRDIHPSEFTGEYSSNGRPEYETVRNNRNGKIGDNWFWIDLNFEKYFYIG